MRHKESCLVLLLLVAIGNSGCAYHAQLRDNFYHAGAFSDQKLPLKVALVREKDAQHFVGSALGYSVYIDVYPALIQSSQVALSNIFDKVRIVESPLESKNQDLLAFIHLGMRELERMPNGMGM